MGNLLTGEKFEVAMKAASKQVDEEHRLMNEVGILEYMRLYGDLPQSKVRIREAMWRAVEQYDAQNGNQEK